VCKSSGGGETLCLFLSIAAIIDDDAGQLPAGTCLYALRHSFITQSLLDGVSTLEVSKIVGTSLALIEKHYGHA
jgi:hypothetical protein